MTEESRNPAVPELLTDFRRILDERLRQENAQLKKSARRASRMAIVLAVLAILMAGGVGYYAIFHAMPGLTAPSFRTREVVLVGPNDQERGYWRVDDEGTARLVMADRDGVERLKLTLRENGEQGVSMADSTGAARVVLGYLDDGSATLAFADRRGQTRTVLGLAPNEESSLVFADPNGGTRAIMGVERDGAPIFWWPSAATSEPADGSN